VADRPGIVLVASGRHAVYRAPGAVVAAGALAGGEDVLLAKDSSVGPRARLQHCSLGAGAAVATNCRLASCVLMEGARVGRGVQLTEVILGCCAEVVEGAKVGSRCLLANGVLVEAGVEVPGGNRLSAAREEDWGEGEDAEYRLGHKAFLYTEEKGSRCSPMRQWQSRPVINGNFKILLYDKDVLEDSAILSWMDQPGPEPALKAAIRGKYQAFVAWLKQEDSNSKK
jgi:carbonic anhydrase/acetyltransferase-like protein (isoleucine patch superfamily)